MKIGWGESGRENGDDDGRWWLGVVRAVKRSGFFLFAPVSWLVSGDKESSGVVSDWRLRSVEGENHFRPVVKLTNIRG